MCTALFLPLCGSKPIPGSGCPELMWPFSSSSIWWKGDFRTAGSQYRLPPGLSQNPWVWGAGRFTGTMWSAPDSMLATHLAEIGSWLFSLLFCWVFDKHGITLPTLDDNTILQVVISFSVATLDGVDTYLLTHSSLQHWSFAGSASGRGWTHVYIFWGHCRATWGTSRQATPGHGASSRGLTIITFRYFSFTQNG